VRRRALFDLEMSRERRQRVRDLHQTELALAREAGQIPPDEPEKSSNEAAPSLWKRLVERARALWSQLWSEHTTPREIGIAVASGVFIGCTPALGLHGWIALGVATVADLNRIWTWVGSRISNILILPWLVIAEIEIGHHLRFGGWLHLTKEEVMARRGKLLVDWILGCIPVGIVAAVVLGLIAFGLSHVRLGKR
jgi:uncharacterized protein (DUF2062 family)